MKSLRRFDKRDLLFLLLFLSFFGYLFVTGEPLYVGDTFQYENQMIMREPVYALLIQLCRAISLQYHYQMIILIQNLLAAAANTAVLGLMRKQFHLTLW